MSKKSELRDKNSIVRKSQNCEIKTKLREKSELRDKNSIVRKSQNCEKKSELRDKNS